MFCKSPVNEKDLYQKIRLNEPWDSEWNSQFHCDNAYRFCRCAHREKDQDCVVSVVVGKGTFFPGTESVKADENRNDKILVVERKTSVCWMDPGQELTLDLALQKINNSDHGIGSFHRKKGAHLGYASGVVQFEQDCPDKKAFLTDQYIQSISR